MLGKLSVRNMKRSARDYMVYILTMTIVAALMYAFSSLITQNKVEAYFEVEPIMEVMIGLATFFILLIVAWLINYMVRFMLEKRSSEFGLYLLLGMKKKTVSRLYMRENLLLGGAALAAGILLGILLQQVLWAVMFAMVRLEYHLSVSFDKWNLLMTGACYGGCYLLALLRCKGKFRKMNIRDLMDAKRLNEEVKEHREKAKRIWLPLSILFILLFWALLGKLSNTGELALFLISLVATIYLFYRGLSAWIICYVRKKGSAIYKGHRLFLLRQFASKIRTMQFTMGTLTALFTLALMGASVALMFSEYENTVLKEKFPFDTQIYSSDTAETFADEKNLIEKTAGPAQCFSYRIYTDGKTQVNTWMLTHLKAWGTIYRETDGAPNRDKIQKELDSDACCYYAKDTYMGLADYNHLRGMLGYEEVALEQDEYLLQVKPRLEEEVQGIGADLRLKTAEGRGFLSCAGIRAEPFSQDGHNGADYMIVVPDKVLERMEPYYSELAVDLQGEAPSGLQGQLERQMDLDDEETSGYGDSDLCPGSDTIISFSAYVLVRDDLISEVKYMLASLIIPLFYIGLVFVCVAVTVLSVQQLSDSAKYKFRYDVLAKLGMGQRERGRLVLKQLAAYYLCPALLAMVISGKMILFISGRFVELTGVPAFAGEFFGKTILLFFSIYLVYFAVTYVSFKRNVEEHG